MLEKYSIAEIVNLFRKYFFSHKENIVLARVSSLAADCWEIMKSTDNFNLVPLHCALRGNIDRHEPLIIK